jgi:hypothetical protein
VRRRNVAGTVHIHAVSEGGRSSQQHNSPRQQWPSVNCRAPEFCSDRVWRTKYTILLFPPPLSPSLPSPSRVGRLARASRSSRESPTPITETRRTLLGHSSRSQGENGFHLGPGQRHLGTAESAPAGQYLPGRTGSSRSPSRWCDLAFSSSSRGRRHHVLHSIPSCDLSQPAKFMPCRSIPARRLGGRRPRGKRCRCRRRRQAVTLPPPKWPTAHDPQLDYHEEITMPPPVSLTHVGAHR